MVLGLWFESVRAVFFLFILLNALPVPMLGQVSVSVCLWYFSSYVSEGLFFQFFSSFYKVLWAPMRGSFLVRFCKKHVFFNENGTAFLCRLLQFVASTLKVGGLHMDNQVSLISKEMRRNEFSCFFCREILRFHFGFLGRPRITELIGIVWCLAPVLRIASGPLLAPFLYLFAFWGHF